MWKPYQLKWCFIISGVFGISTLLIRQDAYVNVRFWEYLDYIFRLLVSLSVSWCIHAYFILNKQQRINNIIWNGLAHIASVLAFMVINRFFFYYFPANHFIERIDILTDNQALVHLIFGGLILSFICYSAFYSIHTNLALQNSKLKNETLEQAHLRAQLISLQQQISPHFLFNSLSTLNAIATDKPTRNYVVQLAAVYRYVLKFHDNHQTPLKDELIFIKSYLYILNERFDKAMDVEIDIAPECLDKMIPSLSLQLLVENAIKHNMFTMEEPMKIVIRTAGIDTLIVSNDYRPKNSGYENTGTGLKNISERYRLLANVSIDARVQDGKFEVILPLL